MFKRRVAEPNMIKQTSRRHESGSVKKKNRHSFKSMSAFVPKKNALPLKIPLAAGKQGMAPSRCVYGFRQECVLKSVIGTH